MATNIKDIWHYPRLELAKQVLTMFDSGLSNALTFFAPRRMGKTEFLRKDMQPLAEKDGWQTLYFSFLDAGPNIEQEFTAALSNFAAGQGLLAQTNNLFKRTKKIDVAAAGVKAGIELNPQNTKIDLKTAVTKLAQHGKTLLLLDEVQALAQQQTNNQFVAALRTALDINKDNVKVIFTGSSQEGLRRMFSQANAPFFHFGQNLPFPHFGLEFVQHLVKNFNLVTKRKLNVDVLWQAFLAMGKVPQLIRSLVERIALNPSLTIDDASKAILQSVNDDRNYLASWNQATDLEKLLLQQIAQNGSNLFTNETKQYFAKQLQLAEVPNTTIQSTLRTLQRRQIIGKIDEYGKYVIDDPNFKNWLLVSIKEQS